MKKLSVLFALLFSALCAVPHAAQSATSTLTWEAPTTNTDGTPCTDLAGYNVYMRSGPTVTFAKLAGTTALTYADTVIVPNNTTVMRCYVVTAFDASGNESDFSNEVCKTFFGVDTVAPKAPGNLRVQ